MKRVTGKKKMMFTAVLAITVVVPAVVASAGGEEPEITPGPEPSSAPGVHQGDAIEIFVNDGNGNFVRHSVETRREVTVDEEGRPVERIVPES